jgi:hypothetical protein
MSELKLRPPKEPRYYAEEGFLASLGMTEDLKCGLIEADADVGALIEVDGVDEADLAFVEGENH